MRNFSVHVGICMALAALCFAGCSEDDGNKSVPAYKCTPEIIIQCSNEGRICNQETGECEVQQVAVKCTDEKKAECMAKGQTCIENTGECSGSSVVEKKCTDAKKAECATKGQNCDDSTGECSGNEQPSNLCSDALEAACSANGQLCDKETGQCVCPSSVPDFCNGSCINVHGNDANNCGECGKTCDGKCDEGQCMSDEEIEKNCQEQHKDGFGEIDPNWAVCDGECVYTPTYFNTASNCGACGKKCDPGEACSVVLDDDGNILSAKCEVKVVECNGGDVLCDGTCVTSNEDHCGENCSVCEEGTECQAGECISICGDQTYCGQTEDGIRCADLSSDKNNCGKCFNECKNGLVCSKGECVESCKENEVRCGGDCVNPNTRKEFCGAKDDCEGDNAGHICATNGLCTDGECVCPNEGLTACKLQSHGALTCMDANRKDYCGCNADFAGYNCAGLKNAISDGATCEDGICIFACQNGFANCNDSDEDGGASDGCETDITSVKNCGGCGIECITNEFTESVACEMNACHPTCTGESMACDGVCVDIQNDDDNCGGCGNSCGSGQKCVAGICTIDVSLCKDNYVASVALTDDETLENVFCITSFEDLKGVRDAINSGDKYPSDNTVSAREAAYMLAKDIEIDEDTWIPMGIDKDSAYRGHFLGNGRTITFKPKEEGSSGVMNVTIQTPNAGLFGYILNAYIDGFILDYDVIPSEDFASKSSFVGALVGSSDSSTISRSKLKDHQIEGWLNVGGIVGYALNSTIDSCVSTGTIVSRISENTSMAWTSNNILPAYTGGLAGRIHTVVLKNSSSSATVKANYLATKNGGLVGQAEDQSEIINCSASGEVSVHGDYAGGLIGSLERSDVIGCSATGKVSAQKEVDGKIRGWKNIGGLIGSASSSCKIEKSSANSEVLGRQIVGGLIGELDKNSSVVDCSVGEQTYVYGVSTSEDAKSQYIGGLIGHVVSSSVTGSKSSGKVRGDNTHVGGLVGFLETGILNGCSSNAEVYGQYAGGLVGVSQSGNIVDCSSSGSVNGVNEDSNPTKGKNYLGGLVGQLKSSTVKDSSSSSDIPNGGKNSGGLIGSSDVSDGNDIIRNEITKCIASGKVKSDDAYSGGLIGSAKATNITDSIAEGDVEAGSYTGGLIGRFEDVNGESMSTLTSVEAKNTVSGIGYVGGLIGHITTSQITISNSQANNKKITATAAYTGGLIGAVGTDESNDFAPEIKNCSANTSIQAASNYVGGLIGSAASSKIDGCKVEGEIDCLEGGNVGGVLGIIYTGTVSDTKSFSSVAAGTNKVAGSNVGGFVGLNNGGKFENCSVDTKSVYGHGNNVGGFVGKTEPTSEYIKCSASFDNLTSDSIAGGFVGFDNSGSYLNCGAKGKLTGTDYTGGFVGKAVGSILENVAAIVNVTGTDIVGGLVGDVSGISITKSYAFGQITENGSDTGAYLGNGDDNVVTIKNSFWWEKAHKGTRPMPTDLSYDISDLYSYDIKDDELFYCSAKDASVLDLLQDWPDAICTFTMKDESLNDKEYLYFMPLPEGVELNGCER